MGYEIRASPVATNEKEHVLVHILHAWLLLQVYTDAQLYIVFDPPKNPGL